MGAHARTHAHVLRAAVLEENGCHMADFVRREFCWVAAAGGARNILVEFWRAKGARLRLKPLNGCARGWADGGRMTFTLFVTVSVFVWRTW